MCGTPRVALLRHVSKKKTKKETNQNNNNNNSSNNHEQRTTTTNKTTNNKQTNEQTNDRTNKHTQTNTQRRILRAVLWALWQAISCLSQERRSSLTVQRCPEAWNVDRNGAKQCENRMWRRICECFRDIADEAHIVSVPKCKAHLSKSEQAKLDEAGRFTTGRRTRQRRSA